jgi:hypothetical protein
MPNLKVKTFDDLRKLEVRLKLKPDAVQITKAGGFVKARFRGAANCVFGATAEEAKQRLLSVIAKKRGIISPPPTDFEKQLLRACR